jgi:hypothetical protein
MPTYQLLTDRTLAQSSAITPTTLIHIVYTGDPSQNIAGSSYKAELSQLSNLFSFSGGSGNCITDLYVSNIHSCSPLNINPLDEGNVYFGSTSGVTIDVTNGRLGIGTTTPQYRLESYGSAGNFSVSLDNTADNFTSISGGTNDFTYLEARTPNTNVVRVGVRPTGDTLNDAYGKQGDGFLYGSITNNGLNIISTPGTGTEDYISFYAGQNALPANTPDIHIQGSGSTRGYVGINNNNPTELLHLKSAGAARIRIEADTDDTPEPDNAEILMSQDGGNTKANISLTPDTNNDLMIGVNAGAGTTPDIRFNTNSDGLTFTTSADTKVIIKNDGKVGIGINEPQYFLQVFSGSSQLYYDPTSVGGRLLLSGSTNIPRLDVTNGPYLLRSGSGGSLGVRAWNDTVYSGYGKVGDMFLYVGEDTYGLNIVKQNGSGFPVTEDYIRFYAGQDAKTSNTPDIHIQGNGTTRGYVGINNSNPTTNLHVSGNTLVSGSLSATTLNLTANNNLNTANNILRFTDTDTGVSDDQFNGKIEFYSSDSSGVGVKSYIAGIVSGNSKGSLIFGTTGQTGSLTGGTTVGERMRIDSSGYVGIGQTSPIYTLDVSSGVETADDIAMRVANDSDKGVYFIPTANNSSYNLNARAGDTVIRSSPGESFTIGTNAAYAGFRFSGGTGALAITSVGWLGLGAQYFNAAEQPSEQLDVAGNARFRSVGATAFFAPLNITSDGTLTTATSDIRLKENIEPLTNSLEKVLQLTGVTYTWIGQEGKRIGFIAQDVEKVIPDLVFINNNTEDKIKGIHMDNITAVLVEAIKEQQKIIEELKVRISNLES